MVVVHVISVPKASIKKRKVVEEIPAVSYLITCMRTTLLHIPYDMIICHE